MRDVCFHPRKSITTGEGGMVTTNDTELAEKLDVGTMVQLCQIDKDTLGQTYLLSTILKQVLMNE